VNVDPWRVERIQTLLPDSTALVEYFLTKKELFSWVVLGDRVVSKRVDVQEEAVQEMVKRLRQAIQAYLSSDAESQALYRWLVQPVEKELRSVRHVVFAPHGVLHYLPFAALQDDEGRYLVERFSHSLIPSATVLGYCVEKGEKVSGKRGEKGVLALSNPNLGSPVYDLPFAEKEVTSLERAYGNVTAFFGREATERVVRNRAGSYGVIHFACHGTYESETPLFSALLMSPEGADDGRLEAHEIFSLNLECDLVTLSACETGLAKITRGDEIIGLARSFIFAGTPSIITSLWKVDDLATAVMVKRFYRYLRAGHSRAEALRRAQLLVKEAVNGHPAAWAAFGLTGDFR
jgi:CHAT domain-containing protein